MSKVRRLDFAEIRIPHVYFDTVKRKIVIVHKLKKNYMRLSDYIQIILKTTVKIFFSSADLIQAQSHYCTLKVSVLNS